MQRIRSDPLLGRAGFASSASWSTFVVSRPLAAVSSSSYARLAGLRSFYRLASCRHPEHAELVGRVLAIAQLCNELATIKTASR